MFHLKITMWVGVTLLAMLTLFLLGFVVPTLWRAFRLLTAPAASGQEWKAQSKGFPTEGKRDRSRTVGAAVENSRLTIRIHESDRTRVMELAGDLDLYTSEAFTARLQTETALETPLPLIVDMTQVTYADSSGWSALVTAHKALSSGSRTLSVALAPETQPEQTYSVMGMEAILPRTEPLAKAA